MPHYSITIQVPHRCVIEAPDLATAALVAKALTAKEPEAKLLSVYLVEDPPAPAATPSAA